ncbi:Uma2 family endonuclease [bacterium]|nr:MAG: Uma2 family endonuclease [bacterium]
MAKPANRPISPQEYLRQERARTDGRSELINGEIHMMAGASLTHTILTSSIDVALNTRLANTPCQAVTSDLRVKSDETEMYTYSDVVLFCEREYEDGVQDTLKTPLVIFEVLSPSTQSYDRGDKFTHYRTIPSLRHYVLVSADQRTIDHFARQSGDTWLLSTFRGNELLRLDPPGVEVPLDEIYRRAGL